MGTPLRLDGDELNFRIGFLKESSVTGMGTQLIKGDERTGAIADTVAKLSGAGINLTALHVITAGAGRYGGILWVKPRDVNKAAKVLL